RRRFLHAARPSGAEAAPRARGARDGTQADRPGRHGVGHPRSDHQRGRQDRDRGDRAQGAGRRRSDGDPDGPQGRRRGAAREGAGEVVNRTVTYRALLFVVLAVAAVVVLVPTVFRDVPSWWPWRQPVRLGLDLQGGTHLLYAVDIEQAIDTSVERNRQDVERALREAQIGATSIEQQGRTIFVRLANKDKRDQVQTLVKDQFPSLVSVPQPDVESAADFAYTLDAREVQRLRDNVREQALKIIRNRIDQFGVAEPTVQAQGSDEIVVQLPGIQDPQRAKDLIGKTALLEFKIVAEGPQAGTPDKPGAGIQVVPGKSEGGRRQSYLVERRTLMTGDVLTDAHVSPGSATEGMAVDFVLDQRGTKEFGQITTTHVGRR